MLKEKLYLFSELDQTAKKNAKALVQEQRFYLAYLAEKLDRDFVEPFIVENLSPQYDDFFEYCLLAAPDGTVGFGHLHVNATRKEDINFLLEFLLQSDYRSSRHSISKIHIDYACPDEPNVYIECMNLYVEGKTLIPAKAWRNSLKYGYPLLALLFLEKQLVLWILCLTNEIGWLSTLRIWNLNLLRMASISLSNQQYPPILNK